MAALYYPLLYPPVDAPTSFQVMASLVTANGTAWLLLTALVGSLPFWQLLPAQLIYLLTLTAYNGSICRQSPALRAAYGDLLRTVGLLTTDPHAHNAEAAASAAALAGCVQLQAATQLALGFLLPLYCVYLSEARQRMAFLGFRGVRGASCCEGPALGFVRLALPALTPWLLLAVGQGSSLASG